MGANFSPSFKQYSGVRPFRAWVQMALPQIYSDSLSYQELVYKMLWYLQTLIDDVDACEANIDALKTAFESLEEYVNNYFENVDIDSIIEARLDAMIESGELQSLVQTVLDDMVSSLNTLTARVDDLEDVVGLNKESIDELQSDLTKLTDTVNGNTTSINSLQTSVTNILNTISDFETRLLAAESAISGLKESVSGLEDKVNKIYARNGVVYISDIRTDYPDSDDDELVDMAIEQASQVTPYAKILWDENDAIFNKGEHLLTKTHGIDFNGVTITLPDTTISRIFYCAAEGDYVNETISVVADGENVTANKISSANVPELCGKVTTLNKTNTGSESMCMGTRGGTSQTMYVAQTLVVDTYGYIINGPAFKVPSDSSTLYFYNTHEIDPYRFEFGNFVLAIGDKNAVNTQVLRCERSNCLLHDIRITGSFDYSNNAQALFHFYWATAIEVCRIYGNNPQYSGYSGYILGLTCIDHSNVHDCETNHAVEGWGLSWGWMAAHYASNMSVRRVIANRVDVHYCAYNNLEVADCQLRYLNICCGNYNFDCHHNVFKTGDTAILLRTDIPGYPLGHWDIHDNTFRNDDSSTDQSKTVISLYRRYDYTSDATAKWNNGRLQIDFYGNVITSYQYGSLLYMGAYFDENNSGYSNTIDVNVKDCYIRTKYDSSFKGLIYFYGNHTYLTTTVRFLNCSLSGYPVIDNSSHDSGGSTLNVVLENCSVTVDSSAITSSDYEYVVLTHHLAAKLRRFYNCRFQCNVSGVTLLLTGATSSDAPDGFEFVMVGCVAVGNVENRLANTAFDVNHRAGNMTTGGYDYFDDYSNYN